MSSLISEDIFAVNIDACLDNILACWSRIISTRLILFGAGQTGFETLSILRSVGIEPLCFADDTVAKQGTIIQGLPVMSLNDALKLGAGNSSIIVCLYSPQHHYIQTLSRINTLSKDVTICSFFTAWLACKGMSFEHYFMTHPNYEISRMDTYRALYETLDSVSRNVLVSHLRMRFMHKMSMYPTPRNDLQFMKSIFSRKNLTYVDGGAYDGDTILGFLKLTNGRFSKVIALEPDDYNYLKLLTSLENLPLSLRKKISVHKKAIWTSSGSLGFQSFGNMGSVIDHKSSSSVNVICLDDLLADSNDPIFIKLDIEGVETNALFGSRQLVNRLKPTWAISVYHRPSDLANIYSWLANCGHSYNFALRCHGGDSSDLMIYAW